ncbi:MAG TPA: heme-copper oxidase subunit III [Microthrixaceae bacterium]|nr:heme-copper oxidase subunit III [Microthrixaceae bacterium]
MTNAADVSLVRPSQLRSYSTAWWGMAVMIMTEATVFVVLLSAYFFLRASSKVWPPAGIESPDLRLAIPFSIVLWASSIPLIWAESSIRNGNLSRFKAGVATSFVMGVAFLSYTIYDFSQLSFGWTENAYASAFYVIVGLHGLHVVVGLLMSVVVQLKAWLGRYDRGYHNSAEVYFLYWHFIDVVWIFVFPALFLGPHIK